jgi:DNA-binding XRE family transcriptional regulator
MTKAYYNIYRSKTEVMNGGLIMVSNEKIYQRIKLLRKESKLTQEQMASYLDVDQSLVTKLENGTRTLNVNLMEKIG